MDTPPLKNTPLCSDHEQRGALMAPFAGWNMPIQYDGIIAETLHTRRAVSCFDICHMGEFLIEGDAKTSGLDHLITARIDNLAIGGCRYSSLLNEAGGVIDDLVICRMAADLWWVVVNAGTIEKDAAHIRKHLSGNARFEDRSGKTGKIDLQGPLARQVIAALAPRAANLGYYTFLETELFGDKAIISRTGYTGELGYEIYLSLEKIPQAWKILLGDARVKPAGLGARDILRLEMGYSLYGQDIDEQTTPLEAGLERFVDFSKDFIGKAALLKQRTSGIPRTRVYIHSLTRRSPRHGHRIFSGGNETGVITSGTFSPFLELGIGMGFSCAPLERDQKITIGDGRSMFEAVVADKPFIKKTSLKN